MCSLHHTHQTKTRLAPNSDLLTFFSLSLESCTSLPPCINTSLCYRTVHSWKLQSSYHVLGTLSLWVHLSDPQGPKLLLIDSTQKVRPYIELWISHFFLYGIMHYFISLPPAWISLISQNWFNSEGWPFHILQHCTLLVLIKNSLVCLLI